MTRASVVHGGREDKDGKPEIVSTDHANGGRIHVFSLKTHFGTGQVFTRHVFDEPYPLLAGFVTATWMALS
jgi:hypothetical protein